MQSDVTTYYVHDHVDDPEAVARAIESANSIPGGYRIVVSQEQADQMRMHAAMQAHARAKMQLETKEEEDAEKEERMGEDPIIALGRLLNDATKVLWRRVSSPKIKEETTTTASSDQTNAKKQEPVSKGNDAAEQRPGAPRRGKSWPSRLRSASVYDPPCTTPSSVASSSSKPKSRCKPVQADSDSDSVDELWKKEGAVDPMTRTIVEGSDEEDGFEHFVLAPENENEDAESSEGVGVEAEAEAEEESIAHGEDDAEEEEDNRSIADVALEGIEIGKAS